MFDLHKLTIQEILIIDAAMNADKKHIHICMSNKNRHKIKL